MGRDKIVSIAHSKILKKILKFNFLQYAAKWSLMKMGINYNVIILLILVLI